MLAPMLVLSIRARVIRLAFIPAPMVMHAACPRPLLMDFGKNRVEYDTDTRKIRSILIRYSLSVLSYHIISYHIISYHIISYSNENEVCCVNVGEYMFLVTVGSIGYGTV